jgi:cobalamin biosynthesis protein CobT
LKGEARRALLLGEVRPSSVGRLLQPRFGVCSEGGAPNGDTGNEICSAGAAAGDDGVNGADEDIASEDAGAGKTERRENESEDEDDDDEVEEEDEEEGAVVVEEDEDEEAAEVPGREEGQEREGGGWRATEGRASL